MDLNPKLHYLPQNQTTPDIYAAKTHIALGQYPGDSCFYEWTITFTIGGSASMHSSEKKSVEISPGALVLTRPCKWHAWHAPQRTQESHATASGAGGWEIAYAVFNARPHWANWLDGLSYEDGIAHWRFEGKAREELMRAMLLVARSYAKNSLLRDDRTMAALEMVLITLSERTERRRIVPDPRIRAAIDAIADKFAEALTVVDLAAAAHLSAPHFSSLFTSAVGVPPGRYIEQVRLDRAAEKLRFGAESIGDFARAVGYSEPKYFAHRFRLRFGHTPRELRRATRTAAG